MAGQTKLIKKEFIWFWGVNRTGVARGHPLVCGVCFLFVLLPFYYLSVALSTPDGMETPADTHARTLQ